MFVTVPNSKEMLEIVYDASGSDALITSEQSAKVNSCVNRLLNHTNREEGRIREFQSLMECKIYYQKFDATILSFASFTLSPALILCLIAFSVWPPTSTIP